MRRRLPSTVTVSIKAAVVVRSTKQAVLSALPEHVVDDIE
jgi:hypothetical protein